MEPKQIVRRQRQHILQDFDPEKPLDGVCWIDCDTSNEDHILGFCTHSVHQLEQRKSAVTCGPSANCGQAFGVRTHKVELRDLILENFGRITTII